MMKPSGPVMNIPSNGPYLSEAAMAVVFIDWCSHSFATDHANINFAIEALFPAAAFGLLPYFEGMRAGVALNNDGLGGQDELYTFDFAESASTAGQYLAKRLVEKPTPINLSRGSFCCRIAEDEFRRRPKTPQDILSRIAELRSEWPRSEDDGPYASQSYIDDLWADMISLHWRLPACPTLPEESFMERISRRSNPALWRAYHAAISLAEDAARANISIDITNAIPIGWVPDLHQLDEEVQSHPHRGLSSDADLLAIKTLTGSFDNASQGDMEIRAESWFRDAPPESSKYKFGPVEGSLMQLSEWMDMDRRTLRVHNGNSGWWIRKTHKRLFSAWFSDQRTYAKANQLSLSALSQDDTGRHKKA